MSNSDQEIVLRIDSEGRILSEVTLITNPEESDFRRYTYDVLIDGIELPGNIVLAQNMGVTCHYNLL